MARLVKALWRRIIINKYDGILGKNILLRRCLTMCQTTCLEDLYEKTY